MGLLVLTAILALWVQRKFIFIHGNYNFHYASYHDNSFYQKLRYFYLFYLQTYFATT